MKRFLVYLVLMLGSLNAAAQPGRIYNQAELDALLAPVALYPDSLVSQILVATSFPDQVAEAANWSRANPQPSGDEAVRAAQANGWHPAVAELAAFPDVLARIAESPQWLRELGEAYAQQEPQVMDTLQQLRSRAQATGNLRSNEQQQVYRQGERIVVQPVYSQVVYVPYYNPLVVFGPWWWPAYRPVVWRPWYARPVFYRWHPAYFWHAQRVYTAPPAYIRRTQAVPQTVRPVAVARPQVSSANGPPSPAAQMQAAQTAAFIERQRTFAAPSPAARAQATPAPGRPYVATPEAQRQDRTNMPAAHGFSHHPERAPRHEVHNRPRGDRRG